MRALAVALAVVSVVTAACGGARPRAGNDLAALGAEYQRLRREPGHWTDPPGAWNPATDAPGGRKRAVMIELGERLAPGSRQRAVAVMGAPDAIARPGDPLWQLAASSEPPPTAPEILVYTWRGHHDFLYLEVAGDRVTRAAWWMAYE